MYQSYADLAKAEINILNMTVAPKYTTVVFEYSWFSAKRSPRDTKHWAKAAFTFMTAVNNTSMNERVLELVTESRKILEGDQYVGR